MLLAVGLVLAILGLQPFALADLECLGQLL
jgi:hypothetical protein